MKYSYEELKSMSLSPADPFTKFIASLLGECSGAVSRAPVVINCDPDMDGSTLPCLSIDKESGGVFAYIVAVRLDGILRVPKGKSLFTIYAVLNKLALSCNYIIVKHDPDGEITYHAPSASGECQFATTNQSGDQIQYIVTQTGTGIYQLVEIMDFDARTPVALDGISEIEERYPLSKFDPDYGDTF